MLGQLPVISLSRYHIYVLLHFDIYLLLTILLKLSHLSSMLIFIIVDQPHHLLLLEEIKVDMLVHTYALIL